MDEKPKSVLGRVIPEDFYDITGRVVPGVVIFAAGYIVFTIPYMTVDSFSLSIKSFISDGNSTIALLALILFVSYSISIIVNALGSAFGFGKMFYHDYKLFDKTRKKMMPRLKRANPRLKSIQELPDPFIMYNFIKKQDTFIGLRVEKIMSQVHMFCTLRCGFLLLAILNVFNFLRVQPPESFYSLVTGFFIFPLSPFTRVFITEIIFIILTIALWLKRTYQFELLFLNVYDNWLLLGGDVQTKEALNKSGA